MTRTLGEAAGTRLNRPTTGSDPHVGRARLLVLAAALLFSTGGAGIKAEAFSAAQVSSFRSGIAAVALLFWLRGRLTWSVPAVAIAAVHAATLTLFVAATKLTTAANAIFLQSTAPLYVLAASPLLLREQFRRRDLGYVAALAAGVVPCLAGQSNAADTAPSPATGNLFAFASSLTWAAVLMSLRAIQRHGAPAGVALSAVVLGNALACVVALPWAWPPPAAAPAADWLTVASLGLLQVALAYICLTSAIGHLSALDVSLLLLIEPVLNPCWTWLLRGEVPGAATLVGGAAIIGATAARSIFDARDASPGAAP